MGFVDFFETYMIGPRIQVKQLDISDWLSLTPKLLILFGYFYIHSIFTAISQFLQFVNRNAFCLRLHLLYDRLWSHVPIIGEYKIRLLSRVLNYSEVNVVPNLDKALEVIEIWFQLHLVEMTFEKKKNVQIFISSGSDDLNFFKDNQFQTTLMMCNHRSVNDYTLINYLFFKSCPTKYYNKLEFIQKLWKGEDLPEWPQLKFLGWGKMFNFPQLDLLKNIFFKDETLTLSPDKLRNILETQNNQAIAIFPEVNIMSLELSMIQRKIHQDFPFVTNFYNLLYPRFKNFTGLMAAFSSIKNIKRKKNHNNIIKEARYLLHREIDKMVHKSITMEPSKMSNKIIPPMIIDNSYLFEKKKEANNAKPKPVRINPYIYDFTIVYYRVKYTDSGHDHIDGDLRIHKGYQLEQISPTIFEMLQPEIESEDNVKEKDPIVAMVHIKKYQIQPLLTYNDESLERWLENRWIEKDRLIDSLEKKIKIEAK
ncbi:Mum3p SKDI_15G4350 [Saccharomyces kudriavzevii IFO 1802]|uniref:MUM3-like protein n=1 Tax=Saccharomyces kudriavzevii (strain ATCC MYA-4449 / AS 2.2408 / CBS 8840 / NBRC 1802 / NCYC 2889) TaxID=226230 RepID=A0AA35NN02_SACK1|nr:uncharacterized protein SKDI_15G4350 [Saccharomyces kudriavzevii IFO 1802]CAI4052225.1 hypothetical protein SKDI_15G4350 [Saccharomyces kudriavzevii IFO 1802]